MHWYERIKRWQFALMLAIYTWAGLTPDPGQTLAAANDLLLHFSGYLVAGISMGLAAPRLRWYQRFGWIFGYSFVIECIQHLVPQRSFDWQDLLANGLGLALGSLLYVWPVRHWERKISDFIAPNPAR